MSDMQQQSPAAAVQSQQTTAGFSKLHLLPLHSMQDQYLAEFRSRLMCDMQRNNLQFSHRLQQLILATFVSFGFTRCKPRTMAACRPQAVSNDPKQAAAMLAAVLHTAYQNKHQLLL